MANPNTQNYWGTNWSSASSQAFPQLPNYWGQAFKGTAPAFADYGKNVFTPGTPPIAPVPPSTPPISQLPEFKGTDTATGQRDVDLGAVPPLSSEAQQWLEAYKAMSPIRMQEQEQASRLAAQLSREQMAGVYPYLSQAAAESTARNLAASQTYQQFLQGLPNAQQQRSAIAASEFAQKLGAISQARDVASRASKGFRGQFLSYG